MQLSNHLSRSLTKIAALALASTPILPVTAQVDGSARELGVIEINLKDAVQFNWGFQGALQGAGTPNQMGIGAFLPIAVGENNIFFLDSQANANFADYINYSSIIDTTVAGTTISTSSRIGYRWLNTDRSWMLGLNAGYDSRPMNTGYSDTGLEVTDKQSVFFQQLAAGLEAVSDTWNFNAYGLFPIGDREQQLNSRYQGGALNTYGLNVGYFITPDFNASIGPYYQYGDNITENDFFGVQGRLAYDIANGLIAAVSLSYDEAFDIRFTADIKYRFGVKDYGAPSRKKEWNTPTLEASSSSPANRQIRVHDKGGGNQQPVRGLW